MRDVAELSAAGASPQPRTGRGPTLLSPEALDFAPDLLAIQERPPARMPRVILIAVFALVGLLVAWAAFFRLDIIASAEGRLVPISFTKVVQPAESGVIKEILVKDGDVVRKGQVLLLLDSRIAQADSSALERDVAIKQLTLRRIEAELANRPLFPGKADDPELYAQVDAQFRARKRALADAVAQETEFLNKARADLRAAQQLRDKIAATLPSYQQSAEAYKKLKADGFIGDLAANEKVREAVEKEQDLKVQAQNVESLQATIAQAEKKIAALQSQYRSQLEGEKLETIVLLNRSNQELSKTAVRAEMLEIRAPNDGVVKDLSTTTQGAVVAAGALLMNIVPKEEPLQAEVLLRNEDVGFVSVGQKAMVKVAAYPFQKYGLVEGEVSLVSADSVDPRQTPQGQLPTLSYRALILLKDARLRSAASDEQLALSSGMAVAAEIHQGERSVLEYLLSPVKKVGAEAARER